MRRRLYFTLPNVDSARRTVDELLLARIDINHIHALAREGTSLEDLPEATILEKSDLVYGMGRGMMVGGFTGAISGIVATMVPAAGIQGTWLILVCAIAGALVGTWASGMISTDVRNSRLERFEKDIEHGQILLMVDTPKERVKEISDMVMKHHPEAHKEGMEPTIPAFP
jgi:hypothetical protein